MAGKKKDPASPDRATEAPPDFETALGRLEAIVSELESGQLSLTDSIGRYEQGVGMLRQCHTALDEVRQKIELLTRVTEDGATETTSLEAEATPKSGPARRPGRRKKRSPEPSPDPPDVDEGSTLF